MIKNQQLVQNNCCELQTINQKICYNNTLCVATD